MVMSRRDKSKIAQEKRSALLGTQHIQSCVPEGRSKSLSGPGVLTKPLKIHLQAELQDAGRIASGDLPEE